jgi:hypothetical protein
MANTKTGKTGTGRFDYVAYDSEAILLQALFKQSFEEVLADIEINLMSPRAKALVITKLEEAYMWVGKAIRDDQIARNGAAPLQEGRKDG